MPSKIEWTDETLNPIRYAAQDRDQVELFLDETVLRKPLRWRKPRMVFVCSMTDLFADFIPDDWIDQMFAMMALCPQHTFQILTKRPEQAKLYFGRLDDEPWRLAVEAGNLLDGQWIWNEGKRHREKIEALVDEWTSAHAYAPLPNVWFGVSVEDQATADARVPILLDTPAAIRWVSYEPALGPVDFSCLESGEADNLPRLDWIVAGGESGNDAQPCHPYWIRDVRDQCQAAGVPFFFKQWGEWVPQSQAPEGLWLGAYRSLSLDRPGLIAGDGTARKVGKKNAGAMLDGRHWQEYPA